MDARPTSTHERSSEKRDENEMREREGGKEELRSKYVRERWEGKWKRDPEKMGKSQRGPSHFQGSSS